MNEKKKILSLFLVFSLFLSQILIIDVSAETENLEQVIAYSETFATGTDYYDNFEYIRNKNGTAEITDYTGSATELQIPSEIDGYTVIGIGDAAFSYCTSLTSITIPDSVTSIGENAFSYCLLTSITIGNGVTHIAPGAFYDCWSLKSITIPDSVTSIGYEAFYDCSSLTSITIPNSVISIGASAFSYCSSLTSVTIPDSVTSIGSSAFNRCSSLTSITVDENNQNFSSVEGVLLNKDKTALIRYPNGKAGNTYTIPNSVTSIGDDAFCHCSSLISIIIPNSVTSIGDDAFCHCSSLTSITIPVSVTSISGSAFDCCTLLTSITVDENNQNFSSVDGVLFNKDKTALIRYPNGKAGNTYTIPNSVTSIGENAFAFCKSLTSVTIPDSVTSIGEYTFYGCSSLTSITIPNSVTNIGSFAFAFCESLTNVTIGNGVKRIDWSAFYDCFWLEVIIIPPSVTEILKYEIYESGSDYQTFIVEKNSYAERYAIDNSINYKYDINDVMMYSSLIEELIDSLSNTVKLDINEVDFDQGDEVFENTVRKVWEGSGFDLTIFDEWYIGMYLNRLYFKDDAIREGIIYFRRPNDSYISKEFTVNVEYNNTKDFNKTDESYVKSLVIESPGYFEVDLSLINEYGLSTLYYAEKYYNDLINDETITIKAVSGAGDGHGMNSWTCESGTVIGIFRNGILYDTRRMGKEITIPVVNIPSSLPESDVESYVINLLNEFLSKNSDEVLKIEKHNDKINFAGPNTFVCVEDAYKVYTKFDRPSYIIIRRENSVIIPTQPTQPSTQPTTQPTKKPTQQVATICYHPFNSLSVKNKITATYFVNGYTGDVVCKKCDTTLTKGKAIAKLTLKTPNFKLTKGKKQFKVKYTKADGATGFQVKYKLKGKWKTKTFKATKTVTKAIKKLKKGTYQVQVRAFVKQGKQKAYSTWTKVKKVKVK